MSMQRNAAQLKGNGGHLLPKPVVICVGVEGQSVCALLDSGSLGDFISLTVIDQLKQRWKLLDQAIGLQLAVQGSRSKINVTVEAQLTYQGINEVRTLDVVNLNDYDLILGTPWIYQHQVCIGLNPAQIIVGSDEPLPISHRSDSKYLLGSAVPIGLDPDIVRAHGELMKLAKPLCKHVKETELPPFRAINHTIPLIDESKTYLWRASRYSEVFHKQWAEKRDTYLKSGWWQVTTARNTIPMLLIPKPHKPKDAQELCTVFDLHEHN